MNAMARYTLYRRFACDQAIARNATHSHREAHFCPSLIQGLSDTAFVKIDAGLRRMPDSSHAQH